MVNEPTECSAPNPSRVVARIAGAHFHDAWVIHAAEPDLDALGQFLRVARHTPPWIERLMAIRNRAVAVVGLKNLGGLSQIDPAKPASGYQPGDRVGIFTLISRSATRCCSGTTTATSMSWCRCIGGMHASAAPR